MKRIFIAFFALTFSSAIFAQDSTSTMKVVRPSEKDQSGVMMKNGKVLVLKNGETSTLKDNITLSNGTMIMANGSAKMSDGTTITMQEGDYFKMDGTRGSMKVMNGNAMDQMKSDSAK